MRVDADMSQPSFCLLGDSWPANGCANMGFCALQTLPNLPGVDVPLCVCRGAFVAPVCQDNFFRFYGVDGAETALMAVFAALPFAIALVAVAGCVEHILDIQRSAKPRPSALGQQLFGMATVALAGVLFGLYWAVNPLGLRYGYNSVAALILPDTGGSDALRFH